MSIVTRGLGKRSTVVTFGLGLTEDVEEILARPGGSNPAMARLRMMARLRAHEQREMAGMAMVVVEVLNEIA